LYGVLGQAASRRRRDSLKADYGPSWNRFQRFGGGQPLSQSMLDRSLWAMVCAALFIGSIMTIQGVASLARALGE
jgi:hypothetical protein